MKLFVVVVAVVCFCFGGGTGGGGPVSFGVWWCRRRFFFSGGRGPVSFFRLACPTFDTCQEVCSVRKGFCQEGILSGRNFVREEFCQGGILSGRNFARKRALPGSGLCQEGALEFVFFWGERCEKLEAD